MSYKCERYHCTMTQDICANYSRYFPLKCNNCPRATPHAKKKKGCALVISKNDWSTLFEAAVQPHQLM